MLWDLTRRLIVAIRWAVCVGGLAFLCVPIIVILPLAFNDANQLNYPLMGFSLRWFKTIFFEDRWRLALSNSLIVGLCATAIAVVLGTMAAYGLTQRSLKYKRVMAAVLVSPIMVPIVVKALAMYFALTSIGLIGTHLGLIIAHALLAMPVVIVPVYATLQGFDRSLIRAAQSLGASPVSTFLRVVLPIVLPGVASGAVFAFAASFDEVVIATFVSSPQQMTLPRMLYSGLRDQLTPAIAAVAATSLLFSLGFLIAVDRLKRRAAQMVVASTESELQRELPTC